MDPNLSRLVFAAALVFIAVYAFKAASRYFGGGTVMPAPTAPRPLTASSAHHPPARPNVADLLRNVLGGSPSTVPSNPYVDVPLWAVISQVWTYDGSVTSVPENILLTAKDDRDARQLRRTVRELSSTLVSQLEAYLESSDLSGGALDLTSDTFRIFVLTHPRGEIKAIAIPGPDPATDEEWKKLVAECSGAKANRRRGVKDSDEQATKPATPPHTPPSYTPTPTESPRTTGDPIAYVPTPTESKSGSVVVRIVVSVRGEVVARVPLSRERRRVVIGRAAGCDVQLPDAETSISGLHLEIELTEDGDIVVADVSRNGSTLSRGDTEAAVVLDRTKTVVRAGDRITLGHLDVVEALISPI